jgi:hypothetical protein
MMTTLLLQLLSVLAQAATLIGLILLYRQIEVGRRANAAQLINELEKEFGKYRPQFAQLTTGGELANEVENLRPEQITQLAKLVAFCEKLQHFLDLGIINWKTLNLMFRARFFIIMDNPNVLKYVLAQYEDDWQAVLRLKTDWRNQLQLAESGRKLARSNQTERSATVSVPVSLSGIGSPASMVTAACAGLFIVSFRLFDIVGLLVAALVGYTCVAFRRELARDRRAFMIARVAISISAAILVFVLINLLSPSLAKALDSIAWPMFDVRAVALSTCLALSFVIYKRPTDVN